MRSGTTKTLTFATCGAATGLAVAAHALAAWTGANSMWAAGLVAAAIACHQSLVIHGLRVSSQPVDHRHPFGYGQTIYIWSYVPGLLLWPALAATFLTMAAADILAPRAITYHDLAYPALGVCTALAFVLGRAAFAETHERKSRHTLLASLRSSDDPALRSVLIESVSLTAAFLAASAGLAAADFFNLRSADGFATAAIAVLAVAAAIAYALNLAALLDGGSATASDEAAMVRVAKAETGSGQTLKSINGLRSVRLAPDELLVMIDVTFSEAVSAEHAAAVATRLGRAIRARFPQVQSVVFESRAFDPSRNLVVFPSRAFTKSTAANAPANGHAPLDKNSRKGKD